jgi:predicted RNA binding protein YcfA (HicA-like mRNA interferase family)
MKLPRDITGVELVKILSKHGYHITKQTGSHIRLTTKTKGEHHITVPNHDPIKIGTLHAILSDVCEHLGISKESLLEDL